MNPIHIFWRRFVDCHKALEQSDSKSLRTLYLWLVNIDARLYLHAGHKDNGFDLILSAEGVPELMPLLDQIVEAAPDVVGWEYIPCYDGTFLFGQRSEELYPDDINGSILYKMACSGDKPWIAREVDFSVIFPDEGSADHFIREFKSAYSSIEKASYREIEGFTFEVSLKKMMFPTHKNITGFEKAISMVAGKHGGRNDGWGCFNEN